jgi:hypothetical protein
MGDVVARLIALGAQHFEKGSAGLFASGFNRLDIEMQGLVIRREPPEGLILVA